MFNDDVQGTGAVIVGGFINAIKASGVPVKDHKAIFLGAGSAGVGVAKQIVEFFKKEGLTEEEARRKFWFVDSNGLVTADRGDKLAEHKVYFARDDNNGRQYQSLGRLIDYVQPTILMGLSTIGGAFNKDILQKMAKINNRPIIFPLSNPSSKSECTFEEAVINTEGRCLFASGSPFPSMEWDDKLLTPGQGTSIITSTSLHNSNERTGNNMYVFPGIGLGAILSKSVSITQDMIYASAESLSTSLNKQEVADGWLYPDIRRIREVSVVVTRGVIRAAQKNGVDRTTELRNLSDDQLDSYIKEHMYDPFNENENVGNDVNQIIASASGMNGHSNGVQHISNGVAHL